jgi:hypothetical protein
MDFYRQDALLFRKSWEIEEFDRLKLYPRRPSNSTDMRIDRNKPESLGRSSYDWRETA